MTIFGVVSNTFLSCCCQRQTQSTDNICRQHMLQDILGDQERFYFVISNNPLKLFVTHYKFIENQISVHVNIHSDIRVNIHAARTI